ncbi:MAG: tail fiber domain-containing protein [Verrucomicrobiota bacterium]
MRHSLSASLFRRGFLLVPVALGCLALLATARAVTPAPDGGYPGNNTAEGDGALFSLTTGTNNTAIGFDALFSNTDGKFNTADGSQALMNNTTGSFNTANGYQALLSNTTGVFNTADGTYALQFNTTGFNNTASGYLALGNNTAGTDNTASGYLALFYNTTGTQNTASGLVALYNNTGGTENTASGAYALYSNTTGNDNTASGVNALTNNTTGFNNIALGANAGANVTTGQDNIHIGNLGVAGDTRRIRIGTKGTQTATLVAGIYGKTVASGVSVIIGSNGLLGTVQSSARFKEAIKPMEKTSEAILQLEPVTFRYKHELDPEGIPQFGLIAEEVEKVNPALVARDEEGKVYTVRYEAVNAMLLNEFLKEHRKVQELEAIAKKQEATAANQQKEIKALTAGLKEQASQIQKVSTQLQVTKPAPRMVDNKQ